MASAKRHTAAKVRRFILDLDWVDLPVNLRTFSLGRYGKSSAKARDGSVVVFSVPQVPIRDKDAPEPVDAELTYPALGWPL